MIDRLVDADAEHFEEVRRLLDGAGIDYELDPRLVRGLDYYTRTVFEFRSDALGAQSGIGGGGRYDRLIEQLGGPPTPAAGWATGLERIAQALDRRRASPRGPGGSSRPPRHRLRPHRARARASASSGPSRSCARRESARRWTWATAP